MTVAAGPGGSRKAEFALAFAQGVRDARSGGSPTAHVPEPMRNVFEFLYESMQPPSASPSQATPRDSTSQSSTDPSPSVAPATPGRSTSTGTQ